MSASRFRRPPSQKPPRSRNAFTDRSVAWLPRAPSSCLTTRERTTSSSARTPTQMRESSPSILLKMQEN